MQADFNLYHLNLLWDSLDKWDTWSNNIFTMDFNQVNLALARVPDPWLLLILILLLFRCPQQSARELLKSSVRRWPS